MTTIDNTRQPALSVTELLDMDDVDLRIERLYYREQILRSFGYALTWVLRRMQLNTYRSRTTTRPRCSNGAG